MMAKTKSITALAYNAYNVLTLNDSTSDFRKLQLQPNTNNLVCFTICDYTGSNQDDSHQVNLTFAQIKTLVAQLCTLIAPETETTQEIQHVTIDVKDVW